MSELKKSIASQIAEAMKKKKKRIIETDPEKKAWKALQSGGLDPVPFDDDFDAYEAKKHLKEELKGMGPEGKRFLKDKLSGKKYEGILKPKYKKDLLKELEGMSSKGKSYVKKELGDTLAEKSKSELSKELHGMGPEGKRFLHDKLESKEYKGKLKGKYKEDLDKELYGMSSKGKSYVKKELGDVDQHGRSYKDYLGEKLEGLEKDIKGRRSSRLKSLKKEVSEKVKKPMEFKGPDFLKPKGWDDWSDKEKKAGRSMMIGAMGDIGKSIGKGLSDKDSKKSIERSPTETREFIKKQFKGKDLKGKKVDTSKWYKDEKGDAQKGYGAYKPEAGDSKKDAIEGGLYGVGEKAGNWIQGAVKKPGALRDTAKRMGLIKGDELLSSKDLAELKSKAKKSGNTLLMRRVNLAKTFKKMKK